MFGLTWAEKLEVYGDENSDKKAAADSARKNWYAKLEELGWKRKGYPVIEQVKEGREQETTYLYKAVGKAWPKKPSFLLDLLGFDAGSNDEISGEPYIKDGSTPPVTLEGQRQTEGRVKQLSKKENER